MIILAPEIPKAAPKEVRSVVVVDRFDRKLLAAVEGHGEQPAPVWPVIHEIVADEQPPSRAHRRQLVARLLCRVRGLIRAGRIEREGKAHVRLREPVTPPVKPPLPPPKPLKNLPPSPYPSVDNTTNFQGGGPSRRVFRV